MIIDVPHELSGTYEIFVKRDGETVEHVPEFKNLITNAGLNTYITRGVPFSNQCMVGTSATAPAVTDTTLVARVANAANTAYTRTWQTTPDYYYMMQFTYAFAVGAVAATINEVGVNYNVDGNGTLFSRALLPAPLAVISTDQLIVIYRLYIKVPGGDVTTTVSDGVTSYDVTRRISGFFDPSPLQGVWYYSSVGFLGLSINSQMTSYARESDVLLAANVDPSTYYQTVGQSQPPTYDTYVANSGERSWNVQWLSAGGNFTTGIGTIITSPNYGIGVWQFKFSPKLAKDTTKTMQIKFKVVFVRGTPP